MTDGTVTATKCYEGFEAAKISISGGDISITSSDDGINASDGSADTGINMGPGGGYGGGDTSGIYFIMSGGKLYINAKGDGLDSNGTATISGGDIRVDGPTGNDNGALDSQNGILVNGGTLVAVGSNGMVETPGSNSQQCCISFTATSSLSAGTLIELRDSSGNTLLSHTTAKTCQSIVLSHPDIKVGSTYTVYINGSSYKTISQTSTVTTGGSSSSGPGSQNKPGGR